MANSVKKAKVGRPEKDFLDYLEEPYQSAVSHSDYLFSPATAFLKYLGEAKDAVKLCSKHIPNKTTGEATKSKGDSLQNINNAMLAAIMGHFETFQKYLFAGIFDFSIYFKDFDTKTFFKALDGGKDKKNTIDLKLERLAAYRSIGADSIGLLLVDAMKDWHNPHTINMFFNAFFDKHQLFSQKHIRDLSVLWQLRHSIVHTAGTLTLADSQKVSDLRKIGERQIAFSERFIEELARKLHPTVKDIMQRLEKAFLNRIDLDTLPSETKESINAFFKVDGVSSWL